MIKFSEVCDFIKTLRVEPFFFIHIFGYSVALVTTSLLIQDKICVNVYEQSNSFCTNITSIKSSEDPEGYKNKVLAMSTQFELYSTLLDTIPSVIWSLFIGSFTDKFIHGRKILMCLSCISGIIQSIIRIINAYYFHLSPYYLLFSSGAVILTGGGFGTIMAVYSYVSANTKESLRSVRYALIEFSFFLGGPLGTFTGGQLLKNTPDSTNGQLHNYMLILSVGLICEAIAFVIVIVLINEKKDKQKRDEIITDTQTLVVNEDLDNNSNAFNKRVERIESQTEETVETAEGSDKWYYPLKVLLDLENVKEVWICCIKKRANSGRLQIWLLFMCMCMSLMAMMGGIKTTFQFSEKAYYWSATYYSNVQSICSVVTTVLMTLFVPLFVFKLKLRDAQLAIVGLVSQILDCITVGSYQHPIGYYISVIVGSVKGMVSIAIRSKLSKLVGKDELGKVFSLMSTLESVSPLLASLVFTFIFNFSIDFFPGLTYEVCALLLIVPLITMIVIDLRYDSKSEEIRFTDVWEFVKTLKVEPYLFIHMFAGSVASVTKDLLLQDKICVNVYEQSNSFCTNLSSIKSSEDPEGYKNKVLAMSTQFGLYNTLLDTIPSLIWSLFIGSFTDKFIHGRKIVMCLSCVSQILQTIIQIFNAYYFHLSPYYLLLSAIPPILAGGGFGTLMAVYSYASIHTKKSLRSIRYAFIEFSFFLGRPLGTYVGGALLKDTPNSTGGQLHNYLLIIGIGLIFQSIAFGLLLVLINEKRDQQKREQIITDRQTLVVNEDLDNNSNINKTSVQRVESQTDETTETPETPETSKKWYYSLKVLFDLQNVKEVWICCTKKRPQFARLQIWLLFMSMCVTLMVMMGGFKTQFQFVEKVYYWSATYYSDVHSISSIVNSVFMTITVPLFVFKLKLRDAQLGIVGIVSHIFNCITVGSYQHPIGFYMSIIIGAVGGMVSIAIRSKLSKLVRKDELGKVFSLLATLESVSPLLASLIFTFIFESSIDYFPGLTYEVCALFLITPLIAMVFMDLRFDNTSHEM